MPLATRSIVLSTVDDDGLVAADALFAVAAHSGHTEKALRDCLGRLVRDGLLTKVEGRGRTATYRTTTAGTAELDADHAWAGFGHRIDAGLEPWDHRWHLVGFEIPERRRPARDALRSVLTELGAAPIQPGLYASPFDLVALLRPLARAMGVEATITSLTTTDLAIGVRHDPGDVARSLWNLDPLADTYRQLDERLQQIIDDARTDEIEVATAMFAASLELEDVLRADPHLPLELLPSSWPGAAARSNFRTAVTVAGDRSTLFRESRMTVSIADAIATALDETSEEFWNRWGPNLVRTYLDRLPSTALAPSKDAA